MTEHKIARRTIVYPVSACRNQLSRLIRRACAGDEIEISLNGVPAVRLVPLVALAEMRRVWLRETRIRQELEESERVICPKCLAELTGTDTQGWILDDDGIRLHLACSDRGREVDKRRSNERRERLLREGQFASGSRDRPS